MKYGVIDIGSNSVRLMINVDGKTIYKIVKTTRLAENMGESCVIQSQPIERTIIALSFLVREANREGVDKLFGFATAAVRKAKNGFDFIKIVKDKTGLTVDVLSSEDEAKAGYLGALRLRDGGVIDIGGASTEISIIKNKFPSYSKSLYIGAVSLTDRCGQDKVKVEKYTSAFIKDYGKLDFCSYYAIGGTATSVASMLLGLKEYDSKLVDGYVLHLDKLLLLQDKLYSMTIDDRCNIVGLQKERAKVIASGVTILIELMKYIGIDKIIVSESDNLEGYLLLKGEIDEKDLEYSR